MSRHPLLAIIVLAAGTPLFAAEILPPANQRFQKSAADETPSFQRHVVPLLGRMGCNGRACHGSFQGQGGFRLSLFGYDFKADHDALSKRLKLDDIDKSLILQKPTKQVDHEGGKRFAKDSWQYHLLQRWLKLGATGASDKDPAFESMTVEPSEIVFTKPGDNVQLRVIAKWADGTQEDVTPLARFRTNDDSVATVSDSGEIKAIGKGDTAIVAFYDNGIVPVSVLMPVSDKIGARYPEVRTSTKIDELVVAKLRKLGVVPSETCTDAEFLRRVSLDLTGTLPAADEVRAFLMNDSRDKRTKKVEELLGRPAYAAWWATRLCDFTGNNEANGPLGGEQGLRREFARLWHEWIERRVRDNMPYDKIAAGIVLATSRKPEQSYEDFCNEFSAYFRAKAPADFGARETMPFFWSRRALGKPEERALSIAHAFLGVSLQCAQCHKHPYDSWTKQDFDQFALFFGGVKYGAGRQPAAAEMKKELGIAALDEDSGEYKRKLAQALLDGKIAPFKEVTAPAPRKVAKGKPNARVAGRVLTPKLLGGEEVVDNNYPDPRQPVLEWMRDEDNPYFARAFVNRVWASYFATGLVDPPDDLNLANPPSNPALLDFLSTEFIKKNFDMKWLHRTIVLSDAYQRSWKVNDTNRDDERNHSRAVLRRIPAEVAYDAVILATASDESRKKLDADPATLRAIGQASCFNGRRGASDAYAVTLFGRPPRTINCDCERSNEPSLLQTVYLRNDPEVLKLLDRPDGWLKQVTRAKSKEIDALVREAYLRTLSRLPGESEIATARQHMADGKTVADGLLDLMWVLLNTKEFIVNK
jgi:hypothetical protein